MPEKSEMAQIEYYIGLIMRKRWTVLVTFCLALTVGIYLVLTLPPIYEANTLILVEPQRVPADYVKSIVSADMQSRISTISQQVLSRSNLEKIIADFKLFSGPEQQNMFMEDKLASLRKQIKVEVSKGRQVSDAFSIAFTGPEPNLTMNVANALASYFINENLRLREEQASGTGTFLEAELESMKNRLEEVEGEIRAFRNKHMGELPEQLDTNLRIIGTFESQLNVRNERLRAEQSRLGIVTSEIEQIQREEQAARSTPDLGPTLAQLREKLAGMQGTYTERHPDLVRLKTMIAEREAQEAARREPVGTEGSPLNGASLKGVRSPLLREKMRQRMEIEVAINNINADISQLNQAILEYRRRVEKTPQREEQAMSLNRDYKNIKETYSSLLNRRLEAEIALNMEKKSKGEQFRILDYAKLPEKPVSPNLIRLFAMFTAGGLAVGLGLIFLMDMINPSTRRPEEIESDLGIRVLATIPMVYHARDKLIARLNAAMTVVAVLVASVLLTGFGLLAFNGIQPTIELLQSYVTI